tara:strand:- start:47390 stop:47626 length:237 start_codon:yes stop_codon:yes gene_type:complete
MKIEIKYFGSIAELIGYSEETIKIDVKEEFDLRSFFEKKYPEISKVNFKIAVNQEIMDCINPSSEKNEVALLPPFAGG